MKEHQLLVIRMLSRSQITLDARVLNGMHAKIQDLGNVRYAAQGLHPCQGSSSSFILPWLPLSAQMVAHIQSKFA